jgi:hypothetical protein
MDTLPENGGYAWIDNSDAGIGESGYSWSYRKARNMVGNEGNSKFCAAVRRGHLYSMVHVRKQKLHKKKDELGLDARVTSASTSKSVLSSSTSSSGIEVWVRGILRESSWFPLPSESAAVNGIRIEQYVAGKWTDVETRQAGFHRAYRDS